MSSGIKQPLPNCPLERSLSVRLLLDHPWQSHYSRSYINPGEWFLPCCSGLSTVALLSVPAWDQISAVPSTLGHGRDNQLRLASRAPFLAMNDGLYNATSGMLMDALLQHNLQHGEPGRIGTRRSVGSSSRPCADPAPEDDAEWIQKNDPFWSHDVSEDHLQDGLSNVGVLRMHKHKFPNVLKACNRSVCTVIGEVEHMLRELARLSEARTHVAGDLRLASVPLSAENQGRAGSLQEVASSTEDDMYDIVRQDEAEVLQRHAPSHVAAV
eukprot:355524-Chlamydomonas_euryale.AAC.24